MLWVQWSFHAAKLLFAQSHRMLNWSKRRTAPCHLSLQGVSLTGPQGAGTDLPTAEAAFSMAHRTICSAVLGGSARLA